MTEVLDLWRTFCAQELDSGGPDSHMEMAVHLARGSEDPAWRIACYLAPYSPVTGAVLFTTWPTAAKALSNQEEFRAFITKYRQGLIIRKDRRSVLAPDKLTDCLLSLAVWQMQELPKFQTPPEFETHLFDFEDVWTSVNGIQHVGRYMAQKHIEALRRAGLIRLGQPDVRPKDAKYVRRGIDMLFATELEKRGNKPDALAAVNEAADCAATYLDRIVSWFQLEVLLCNFRQGLSGRYPGRTQDSDRVAYEKALAFWGEPYMTHAFDFYGLRRELFNSDYLGEIRGWPAEVRKDKVEEWKAIGAEVKRGHALANP